MNENELAHRAPSEGVARVNASISLPFCASASLRLCVEFRYAQVLPPAYVNLISSQYISALTRFCPSEPDSTLSGESL